MASPNFDALSIALSKKLGDPVAAAATDGKVWTSALRTLLLNDAHRKWTLKQLSAGNMNALKHYKNREGQALTNNVLPLTTWTGGVAAIISAYNSTDAVYVKRLPDGMVGHARAASNTYYTPSTTNQFWVVEDGSFVLMDGGTTTGDTIVLEYVRPHADLAVGQTSTVISDTTWSATGTAVTAFTGTIASHVGGTFVGLDNGANAFSRKIVAYVSATAFTISAALVADGAGTNGYIIPPASSDTLVPDTYWHEILSLALQEGLEEEATQEGRQVGLAKEQFVNQEIAESTRIANA